MFNLVSNPRLTVYEISSVTQYFSDCQARGAENLRNAAQPTEPSDHFNSEYAPVLYANS